MMMMMDVVVVTT